MLAEVGNVLVHEDIITKRFACDLVKCMGCCCITGVSGAPLSEKEAKEMPSLYELVKPILSEQAVRVIEQEGIFTVDEDGDKVTPLVKRTKQMRYVAGQKPIVTTYHADSTRANNYACAYVVWDGDIAKCAFELLWEKGDSSFQKPISCHLYPLRITEYEEFDSLVYEQIDICRPGRQNPSGVPLYAFLKDSLIRRFGEEWYMLLCQIAETWQKTDLS